MAIRFAPVPHIAADALGLWSYQALLDLYLRAHALRWRPMKFTEREMAKQWGVSGRRVWMILDTLVELELATLVRGAKRKPSVLTILDPTSAADQPEKVDQAGSQSGHEAGQQPGSEAGRQNSQGSGSDTGERESSTDGTRIESAEASRIDSAPTPYRDLRPEPRPETKPEPRLEKEPEVGQLSLTAPPPSVPAVDEWRQVLDFWAEQKGRAANLERDSKTGEALKARIDHWGLDKVKLVVWWCFNSKCERLEGWLRPKNLVRPKTIFAKDNFAGYLTLAEQERDGYRESYTGDRGDIEPAPELTGPQQTSAQTQRLFDLDDIVNGQREGKGSTPAQIEAAREEIKRIESNPGASL